MTYLGYDKAGLDAQYYMRGRVPEWQDFFDRWEAWSRQVRGRRRCRLNLAYVDQAGETVDVFPAAVAGAPLHVFIHGGYWQAMSKDYFSYVADGLVDAGATLALVEYTLAPEADIDEIVRQNTAALAWLWRHAADFGADPNRLFISGHSAGGHLVAMAMATDWPAFAPGLPGDLIKGGCAISGLFDLEPMRLCYVKDKLRLTESQVARYSPILHVPGSGAPLIVAVGGDETEEFLRQSEVYAGLCGERGVALTRLTPAGENHYTIVDALGDPAHRLTRAILAQMAL